MIAHDDRLNLPAPWFVGLACNALSMLDHVRVAAGAPGTEYGLELAVHAPLHLSVWNYGDRSYGTNTWNAGSITFPRYPVGDPSQFTDVIELIDRDFWNAVGNRDNSPLRIGF